MDLKGREIFAVGKWNDMNFTEADLDDIAANFESLNEIHRVPLKFGHNDEQAITDGQPAIGWVNRVFREGNKLFADFVDMPKSVYAAIKNKLYRTVSIELLFDVDHKGTRFGHVLDAVALLGADHPAVNTLADLDALLATRTSFAGGRKLCFETIAGTTKKLKHREVNSMDAKEIKDAISDAVTTAVAPIQDQLETVTKERNDFKTELDTANRKQAEFEADQKKEKVKLARKTVTELLCTAVREKQMTPAMRETYASQIGVSDDDRVLEIDVDQVKLMCNTKKDDSESGRHKNDADTVSDNPAKELTNKTHAFMAEHGEKSFTRALTQVARANPDLHKQYLDSNGEA